jgi:predicted dehydrogenase
MKITRRTFITQAATAAIVSPFILPSRIRAAETAPNSLVNMAFIGMGIQNRQILDNFLWCDVKIVAVCDVDTTRRENALKMVKRFHADHPEKGAIACKAYNDFREIMARKDIDAVCIATPDHWHAIITLAALKAGKDVYCEKPLTHNIHEALEVMAAVKRYKRVLQTGSHQRSASEFRVACELVRNGVIGKIERVTCKVGGPARPCDLPEEGAEPGLDWNLWLGPAPVRPYNSVLSPRGVHSHYPEWRAYSEYGGGGVCDYGAHHFDIAQWGLGMDESGPVEVRPPEKADALSGAVVVYENGVTVTQVNDGSDVHFYGTEGEVKVNGGGFEFVRGGETIKQWARAEKEFLADARIRLYYSKSHTEDFLARVADRKRPVASEIEGAHSAICCHLMNLAYCHRQTIKWNPHKLAFADRSCDPSWLTCDYRKPWKV